MRQSRERNSLTKDSSIQNVIVSDLENNAMVSLSDSIRGVSIDSRTEPLTLCEKLTYEKIFYRPMKRRAVEREDLRLSHPQRELVYEQPQATGFATRWSQYCTGELKKQALTDFQSQFTEGIGVPNSNSRFSNSTLAQGANTNIVQYLGIAADEPERIARHTKPGYMLPLVDIGWDEAYCRKWCEENNLLSPIYTDSARGGCWFCHNQGVEQLRLLRKNYPELWTILLKWDSDSPTTFHADGHTVHDFDTRFFLEDLNLVPMDRKFRWKMLTEKRSEMLDTVFGMVEK